MASVTSVFGWIVQSSVFLVAAVSSLDNPEGVISHRDSATEQPLVVVDDSEKENHKTTAELVWKSGDRLPGRPIGLKEKRLTFESKLFRKPLEIDVNWLKSFEVVSKAKSFKSDETFAVQLIDGQVLFGDIKKLDEDILTVESKRAGKFEIDRPRIASITNQKLSQTLVAGNIDLDRWNAKRGDKRYWKSNSNGEVVATRDDIHLYLESELPESCLIDLEVAWDEALDFTLALEIPYGARSLGYVPRLESWEGSIVFRHDDDFEVVLPELEQDTKSLKLLIHWDRKTNEVVIHDEKGAELASALIRRQGENAKPGIFFQNKNGDLHIKSLGIRNASPGFDPSKTSLQLKSKDAVNATMKSFDGSTWVASDSDGDAVEIAAEEFVAAFKFNPDSKLQLAAGDTLRFEDGEKVVGELVAVSVDSVTVKTQASPQPIVFKTDRLRQIQFDRRRKTKNAEKFNHVLVSDVGKLRGRLESGSPTDDNVLFWRVQGASEAVPFASSVLGKEHVSARVTLERDKEAGQIDNEWPDTLFLNNRDLLPVKFRSANETEIVVDSFFENRVLPGAEIRAVEFGAGGQTEKFGFASSDWLKSPKVKLSKGKFKLKKTDTVGHADLMGRGGFEFELDWSNHQYGILNVDFGRSLSEKGKIKEPSSVSFAIMLYAQQCFVTAGNDARNVGNNPINKGAKPIKFRVVVEKDKLVVYAKNKKCYTKKLVEGFGRSVGFRLSDQWGQNISCTLSNLELADGALSGEYIDVKRKEMVLTIPRLKARNPPAQILCATNFDLARGNLVSVNDEHVMFRSGGSVNRYSRDVLSSIVWIDTESLIASLAEDELGEAAENAAKDKQKEDPEEPKANPGTDENCQVVQVLMRGGRRVTLALERWADDKIIGHSALLGVCEIPFKQIYEIRMGKYANEATDVPWSDWVAKLAPKPKLDGNNGAGQEDSAIFGSDSPLIGQAPKLNFKMLDGKKVKLESLKGQIVVLDFWATWCGPCVKSLPNVKKVIDGYPESTVTLITINQNESKEKVKSFLKSRKLDFKVAMDDGEISDKFKVEAIPQTVIVDADGKVQFVKVGVTNDMEKKLRNAIDSLLDSKQD